MLMDPGHMPKNDAYLEGRVLRLRDGLRRRGKTADAQKMVARRSWPAPSAEALANLKTLAAQAKDYDAVLADPPSSPR